MLELAEAPAASGINNEAVTNFIHSCKVETFARGFKLINKNNLPNDAVIDINGSLTTEEPLTDINGKLILESEEGKVFELTTPEGLKAEVWKGEEGTVISVIGTQDETEKLLGLPLSECYFTSSKILPTNQIIHLIMSMCESI